MPAARRASGGNPGIHGLGDAGARQQFGLSDAELMTELAYLDLEQSMAGSRGVVLPYSLLLLGMLSLMLPFAALAESLGWAAVFATYIAARWRINRFYATRSAAQRKQRLRRWHRTMEASSFLFGVLVSVPLWLVFPASSVDIKLLWTMVIAMVVSAAPRLITFRQFLALVLATATLSCGAWLVWGGDLGPLMAGAVGFLCVLLALLARHAQHGLREKFELHLRNDHLVRALAQRNTALEQMAHARTLLLAAASHDLRQPVHALGLLMESLQRRADATTSQRRLSLAADCVDMLSEMLSNLLDITRLDAGHLPVHREHTLLQDTLDDVMRTLRPVARRKNLNMRMTPSELWVDTDAQLLRRMVFNLVSNAIKYTERGSIHLYVEGLPQQTVLHVQDTGIGIAPDRLEEIFVDYVTSDTTASSVDAGIGLGLGIVRRCAQLLDHQVTVMSTPGEGSCFSIHLGAPVRPDPAQIEEGAPALEFSGVVAVVENDPAILEGLNHMLLEWLPAGGGCHAGAGAGTAPATARAAPADSFRPAPRPPFHRLRCDPPAAAGHGSGAGARTGAHRRHQPRPPGSRRGAGHPPRTQTAAPRTPARSAGWDAGSGLIGGQKLPVNWYREAGCHSVATAATLPWDWV